MTESGTVPAVAPVSLLKLATLGSGMGERSNSSFALSASVFCNITQVKWQASIWTLKSNLSGKREKEALYYQQWRATGRGTVPAYALAKLADPTASDW